MSTILENARNIRQMLLKVVNNLSDADASIVPDMFPRLKEDGSLVKAGTRINWNNEIMKANVDLWDTISNNPVNSPTLWGKINYKDGYRIIPEIITITDAFYKDELGWWGDKIYKSLVDNNVYTPEEYEPYWELIK